MRHGEFSFKLLTRWLERARIISLNTYPLTHVGTHPDTFTFVILTLRDSHDVIEMLGKKMVCKALKTFKKDVKKKIIV